MCAVCVLYAAWIIGTVVGNVSAAVQAVNACSIVSAADIQRTLGIAVSGDGKAVDIGIRHSCDWKVSNSANLRLAVFTSPKAETLTSGPTSGPRAWEPVPALGERAGYRQYTFAPGILVEEVEVVLVDRAFFVQVTGHADQMPAKSGILAMARLVAKRLP